MHFRDYTITNIGYGQKSSTKPYHKCKALSLHSIEKNSVGQTKFFLVCLWQRRPEGFVPCEWVLNYEKWVIALNNQSVHLFEWVASQARGIVKMISWEKK